MVYGGMERTEKQWRGLLEGEGLRVVRIEKPEVGAQLPQFLIEYVIQERTEVQEVQEKEAEKPKDEEKSKEEKSEEEEKPKEEEKPARGGEAEGGREWGVAGCALI